jgi:hypothetical protein
MNIFSEVPSCLIKIFGYRPVDQNAHGFGVHSVHKVETPIRDGIRELVTWECKEHGVKS